MHNVWKHILNSRYKMKATRKLGKNREENEWYGYNYNELIAVNIQLLWETYEDEDKFIKNFAKTYTHELLHQLIDDILQEVRYFKEEEIIRKMLKEPWNEAVRKLYR